MARYSTESALLTKHQQMGCSEGVAFAIRSRSVTSTLLVNMGVIILNTYYIQFDKRRNVYDIYHLLADSLGTSIPKTLPLITAKLPRRDSLFIISHHRSYT